MFDHKCSSSSNFILIFHKRYKRFYSKVTDDSFEDELDEKSYEHSRQFSQIYEKNGK